MVGSFVRLAAAAALCAALAACTTAPPGRSGIDHGSTAEPAPLSTGLQCVPYAREQARIPIYGDAYTWWDQAEGRYARSMLPSQGSVLVLHNYAGPERAHLAVVRDVVDAREIRVDHANWLEDGAIFVDDPVRDVSPDNDWSLVRVFNARNGAWGARVYDVRGFIGPGPETNPVFIAGKSAPTNPAGNPEVEAVPPQHDYVADLLENDPAFSKEPLEDDSDPESWDNSVP